MVGASVRIDGVAREVIAVMPEGFAYPQPESELWVQLEIDPARAPLGVFGTRARAGSDPAPRARPPRLS